MKALTITEPFATLVAFGQKRIETRGWYSYHVGPLAIHAGKGFSGVDYENACGMPIRSALKEIGRWDRLGPRIGSSFGDTRGKVVAIAEMVACVPLEHVVPGTVLFRGTEREYEVTEREHDLGWYGPGRYGFLLADVRPLVRPIAAVGALGLWDWDESGLEGAAA